MSVLTTMTPIRFAPLYVIRFFQTYPAMYLTWDYAGEPGPTSGKTFVVADYVHAARKFNLVSDARLVIEEASLAYLGATFTIEEVAGEDMENANS